LEVSGTLGLQMPLDCRDHVVLAHLVPLRSRRPRRLRRCYYYEMSLSRQEPSRTSAGRANQKARTRAALLQAAAELVREGNSPSMPQAADRALVSVATAYRYFPSAEDLWWEASNEAVGQTMAEVKQRVDDAGSDPRARLDALLRSAGFRMLDDQVPYRRITKVALEHWFGQVDAPERERVPVRQRRRNEQIDNGRDPLDGHMT